MRELAEEDAREEGRGPARPSMGDWARSAAANRRRAVSENERTLPAGEVGSGRFSGASSSPQTTFLAAPLDLLPATAGTGRSMCRGRLAADTAAVAAGWDDIWEREARAAGAEVGSKVEVAMLARREKSGLLRSGVVAPVRAEL